MKELANKYIDMGITFLNGEYADEYPDKKENEVYKGLETIIEIEETPENPKEFISELAEEIQKDNRVYFAECFSSKEYLLRINFA